MDATCACPLRDCHHGNGAPSHTTAGHCVIMECEEVLAPAADRMYLRG
jgi:hypothetical protein